MATTADPENGVVGNETWLKLIAKVGLNGAIGAFLVYQLSQKVVTRVESIDLAMQQHVSATQEMKWALGNMANIQLADCVNQAGANGPKREVCFAAAGGRPPQR